MKDSVGPPFHNGIVAAGVGRDGSKYQFPGWQNNVDAAGNLVGAVSATDGQVTVADPQHLIEPKNGKFKISGVMQSALASTTGQLPNGVVGRTSTSSKRRGRSTPVASGRSRSAPTTTDGRPDVHVGRRRHDRHGDVTRSGDVRRRSAAQLRLLAEPEHAGGRARRPEGHVDTSQVNNVDPSGRFSTEVTFGKKPGSTDPEDSFAGWLHEVQVSIG